jgi:adenylate kinase family enzyme
MNHKQKTFYFITGASGVGKTSLVDGLKKKYESMPWAFLHFDSIGVPSTKEMEKEWIGKIINEYDNEKTFLEGQVKLQFIYNAFRKNEFENYNIALLDCNEEEMAYRLIHRRKQPELLTDHMSASH